MRAFRSSCCTLFQVFAEEVAMQIFAKGCPDKGKDKGKDKGNSKGKAMKK